MDNIPVQSIYMIDNFRYNCIRGQFNNEGGGELHEVKQSRKKAEKRKEII